MRGVEQIPWLYDAMCWVLESTGLKRWRDWLTGGAKGRTLEVGCGTGRNLTRYPPGTGVIALEPDPHMLDKARHRAPQALFVRGSAEALPFRDGAFDTVVSGLVFCSVPKPEVGLAEVKRVLAPEGRLRMLEHVRSEGWYGGVQDFLQPAWTKVAGGCHPNRRTVEAVEAAGFTIEEDGRRSDGTMRRFSAKKAP
ncbi:MAG: class I SAM-dependent methyltransferase [Archangium sp.]|nr:class I SAM-dependent methyltransferase [Archangium sp.]